MQRLDRDALVYMATGTMVGANGQQIPATVYFDQGAYDGSRWVALDPTDHLGDVCAAVDNAERPIDSTTVPAAFFPWRFHPDEPLPSTPYDCSIV
jgi:hypothetical protein